MTDSTIITVWLTLCITIAAVTNGRGQCELIHHLRVVIRREYLQ